MLFRTKNDSDLLVRAGLVHKQSAGLYSFLPLGLRVLSKLKKLLRNEFKMLATEMQFNLLLSDELWKKTGRIQNSEIFRFNDLLLAPTHEEEVTNVAKIMVQSYKDLPLRVFQIGPKFRFEKRPRMGLLRAREFTMKDLYSFDINEMEARKTFDEVNSSYERIFKALDLDYLRCEADSGDIGGDLSNEYHIISEHGEDSLLQCLNCGYVANSEKAVGSITITKNTRIKPETILVIDELKKMVDNFENIADFEYWKTEKDTYLVIKPFSREPNMIKLECLIGRAKEIKNISWKANKILIENSLMVLENMPQVCDRNVLTGDFIQIRHGDHCRKCNQKLNARRGIEVGHTFYLGTKYSSVLGARYKDSKQKFLNIEMGCYGIGVSRLMAAIPLVSNDKFGIIWPKIIAPFRICVILVNSNVPKANTALLNGAKSYIDRFLPGLEDDVILDDRNLGFSAKLSDAFLVGYPYILIFGKDFLSKNHIELRTRCDLSTTSYLSDSNDLARILNS